MLSKNKVFLALFLLLFVSVQIVHADNNVTLEWAGDKQFIQDYDANVTINIKNTSPNTIYAQYVLIHFSWSKSDTFMYANCLKYILPNEVLHFNCTIHTPAN